MAASRPTVEWHHFDVILLKSTAAILATAMFVGDRTTASTLLAGAAAVSWTATEEYVEKRKQKAFEKCWAHSPLRAAARRLFYIAIHQVLLLSHAACASMSTTTSTTTTTRDRGDRYGPMEWAKQGTRRLWVPGINECFMQAVVTGVHAVMRQL